MDPKTTKILNWLKQKLGDKPLSPYEVNVRTTDILFHLAECNETRDSDVSLVIEDLKLKTKETVATANYLKELLLESVGPSLTCFSRTPNSYLNELVECALVLDIKNTSLSSYTLAVNELTTNLGEADIKNQKLDIELTRLREKFTAALELNKTLEQDLEKAEGQCALETAKVNKRIQDVPFLNAKSNEAVVRIKKAEEELSARGMDPSLSHSSLMALSEKLEKLKEETVHLNTKLESYMDLSPAHFFASVYYIIGNEFCKYKKACHSGGQPLLNLAFAEMQLDAARKEAAALDAELAEKVDILSRNLPYDVNRRQT